jgi:hypothetical protein
MSVHDNPTTPPPAARKSPRLTPKLTVSMDFGGLSVMELFEAAMEYVNVIVFSENFRAVMSDLMPIDFHLDSTAFDNILKSKFVFLPNLSTELLSAYAWTNPTIKDDGSFIIYFNSQLLVNYAMLGNGSDKILFLVVKIVHELAHILNYHCCSYFKTYPDHRTPEKGIDQEFKIRKPNQQIVTTKKTISYEDFGEMVELKLFGSLVESTTQSGNYMQTDQVIAYPSIATFFGNVVDSENSLRGFMSMNFKLVLGDEYESKRRPAVLGISTDLPGIRLSAPGEPEEYPDMRLPSGVRI